MERFTHVVTFCLDHPWALTEPYRDIVATVIARRVVGLRPDAAALEAVANRRREELPQPRKGGAVGIIPIHGVIVPRANMMTEVSGLTSTEGITAAVREAVADPSIRQIVLDIDSPGGNVAGCTECVDAILAAREKKPIIALAHFSMGSAAYWIGSAATEIVASPSAQVGSIGVYAMHDNIAGALKSLGIERTYISEGKHKLIGKPTEPLSEADRAEIAGMVKESYSTFVSDVARGRKVPKGDITSGYGEGRIVGAAEALRLGMVDRVATLDETIARLSPGSSPSSLAALHDSDLAFYRAAERALFDLSIGASQ